MSKNGICFFAYNTTEIDYIKFSILSAMYAKKHMKHNQTCLITKKGDYDYAKETHGDDLINKAFDHIVFTEDEFKENERTHYDSPWTKFKSQFNNSNKHKVFEYSPFDRTLMFDIDYIVQNDNLDYVFETNNHVTMYNDAVGIDSLEMRILEKYLNPVGIPMWWSTVVYFDKSEFSKLFFDLWGHVVDNYDFYKFLYKLPGTVMRTDFCASIAAHILNGMMEGDVITTFKDQYLVNMDQKDELEEVVSAKDFIFLANNREENWKDIVSRIQNTNVHMMNKRSVDRNYDALMEAINV